jgi:hypothetical protein
MTPESMRRHYAGMMNRYAETAVFVRSTAMPVPDLPPPISDPTALPRAQPAQKAVFKAQVRIRLTEKLVTEDQKPVRGTTVQQSQHTAIVLAEDLQKSGFPGAPMKGDKIERLSGRTLTVIEVDESTVRLQGLDIAYKLTVSGV